MVNNPDFHVVPFREAGCQQVIVQVRPLFTCTG